MFGPQIPPPVFPPIPDPILEMPPRIPALAYRHASPSGPWPWRDLDYDNDDNDFSRCSPEIVRGALPCPHTKGECAGFPCWTLYPQSLFPNWTPGQVKRSQIIEMDARSQYCRLYIADVDEEARFTVPGKIVVGTENFEDHTNLMQIKACCCVAFLSLKGLMMLHSVRTEHSFERCLWTTFLYQ